MAVPSWSGWRKSLLDLTQRTLSPDDQALIDGLCFGATGFLDEERKTALRETGTAHIVAASGLHVLVLASALVGIFGLLPVPRGVAIALVASVLVLYACAAGLHPAVVRAALMGILGAAAYLFRRESDPLSALGLAAILVLLWRPESLYQPGFHLTVIVAASLILFGGRRQAGLFRSGAQAVAIASVASAPIMALEFGFVPIISLLLNLFMTLLLVPIILLAMLAWVLSPLWDAGAANLMRGAGTLANALGWLLDLGAAQRWASLPVRAFSPYWLVLLYGVPILLWRKHLRPAE